MTRHILLLSFIGGNETPMRKSSEMLESSKNGGRLVEVDALRGLAAIAVVLFHYTTRFSELFSPGQQTTLAFPLGHLGVNLFFIISGFVIFMTLERTKRPLDFVVSRFSRLFPAYWVAIVLTFVITHLLGLPGKLVDLTTALANGVMIHGIFGIAHVDGVYWTLEIELLFYCWMLLLYWMRRLQMIFHFLLLALALRAVYYLLFAVFGVELSWRISHLLILKYIPWFALGISIFVIISQRWTGRKYLPSLTLVASVACLLLVDSPFLAAFAAVLAAGVYLAASGHLPLLRAPLFVWLGSISYPLYLLHENIGWSLQLRLIASSMSVDAAALVALACALLLASVVARWVEQPAMRRIRSGYRNRRAVVA